MSINYGYFDHSANDLIGKNMNSMILKYDIYIIGYIRTYMKDLLWKRNYSIKTQSHIIKYVFYNKDQTSKCISLDHCWIQSICEERTSKVVCHLLE